MFEEEDSRKAEIQKMEHLQNLNLFSITAKQVIISCSFVLFSQSILIISDILTKIYKITIACFKPKISVGSTLAHARYYLDDPVHLLVSCAELQKCDCNFVQIGRAHV